LAVVALLGADPGKDLPGDLVLGADLLVDPQKVGGDVAAGELRGRIAAAGAARTALPYKHRDQRRADGE
jgi:hypothetical protein